MQVQINNITGKTKKSWEKLLQNHPHNTVFQSYKMYSFYKRVQNFEPFLFLCDDENGNYTGVLLAVLIKEGKGIKGYLSSRVIVYGGPVISEDATNKDNILNFLLTALVRKLKNSSIFIQFRNFFEWTENEKQIFQKHGFSFKERLNLLVDTTDIATVMSNISFTKQRQIRKGFASGVQIVEPECEEDVKKFYTLLFDLYSNKVKKPLPSWSFFKVFFECSKQGKLGIIRMIKFHDQIIGGILCPVTIDKNIYEWYVVGLDKDYKKNYPSVLATWSPIEYALQNNLQHFDFMGLGKPENDYGVRDFKMKFGKNIVNYGRFGRRNKLLYGIVEIGYNILRTMKKI